MRHFDEMLKSQNTAWGIRDLDDVIAIAKIHNLQWRETVSIAVDRELLRSLCKGE